MSLSDQMRKWDFSPKNKIIQAVSFSMVTVVCLFCGENKIKQSVNNLNRKVSDSSLKTANLHGAMPWGSFIVALSFSFFLNNLKRKSFLEVLPVYLTPTIPTDLLGASNGEKKGSKFQYNFKSWPTFFFNFIYLFFLQ